MSSHSEPNPQDEQALGNEARRYLRWRHAGVLSTLSKELDGYPFGSVVPFVLDQEAHPVILISRLAEHTRNLAADPRASLIAQDLRFENSDDVQASARLTCVADAEPLLDSELPLVQARYLRFFPDAEQLLALGDFRFWRLRVKTLRHIGGFGRIHWIAAEHYAPPANALAEAEESIIEHMNSDHAHNLIAYAQHFLDVFGGEARMVGIDCDGIDLRVRSESGHELHRIDLDPSIHDVREARDALMALAEAARS